MTDWHDSFREKRRLQLEEELEQEKQNQLADFENNVLIPLLRKNLQVRVSSELKPDGKSIKTTATVSYDNLIICVRVTNYD